ncbi:MAG: UDP-N-acetylmuramoyl-tripeptide--D-alanyl-D-alanine ligase, partial [Methylococcales bacterium]|nr:UDP-N-acetylmuramoyl-tripeptide--D-alanyl-D-alanine ligase [Methylococcales bacterium]
GKTSVTNIVKQIFACAIPGVAPQGSFNNQWGVPLTLLKLRDGHQSAVIEMGMNHAGELTYLGKIVKPTIGLITNAAAAHLEGLGTIQGVADAKGELIDALDKDGVVILNRDDRFYTDWKARANKRRVISFGTHAQADVRLVDTGSDELQVQIDDQSHQFEFSLMGQHNQLNAAAAIAVAISAEVNMSAIASGLKSVSAVKGRLQILQNSSEGMLIDDTYNANAASMAAAIDVLVEQAGMKILVLGAMGELGKDSENIHYQVAAYAKQKGVDCLLTLVDQSAPGYLSDMAAYMSGFGSNSYAFTEISPLLDKLNSVAQSPKAVLVKGSLFAQMGRVVDAILKSGSAQC